MKKLRIGFIGAGYARHTQAPMFERIESVELTAVASARAERAKEFASEYAMRHVFSDWRELITCDDVDLVCITPPPDLHCEMAIRALEAGKHVLCEKPMAMNTSEAERMTETAKKFPGQLALIDHEMRFDPSRRQMREMIAENFLGTLYTVRVNFSTSSRGYVALRGFDWWSERSRGGGVLGAIGSHIIDAVYYATGDTISSVASIMNTAVKERPDGNGVMRKVETDDNTSFLFRLANKKHAGTSGAACMSVVGADEDHTIEFIGSEAAVKVDVHNKLFARTKSDQGWKEITPEQPESFIITKGNYKGKYANSWQRAFYHFAKEIVENLVQGKSHIPDAATFADGLATQRVLDAVVKANESKRWEKV